MQKNGRASGKKEAKDLTPEIIQPIRYSQENPICYRISQAVPKGFIFPTPLLYPVVLQTLNKSGETEHFQITGGILPEWPQCRIPKVLRWAWFPLRIREDLNPLFILKKFPEMPPRWIS